MNAPIQSFFAIPKVRFAFFQFTKDELMGMAASMYADNINDRIKQNFIRKSSRVILELRNILMGLQFGNGSLDLNIKSLRKIMREGRNDKNDIAFLTDVSSSTDIFIDEIFKAIKCFPVLSQIVEDSEIHAITRNRYTGKELTSNDIQYSCAMPRTFESCVSFDEHGVLTALCVCKPDNNLTETITSSSLFSVRIMGYPGRPELPMEMLVGKENYTLVASYSFETGHGINGHFIATRRTIDGRDFHHFDDLSAYDAIPLKTEDITRMIDTEGMAYYIKSSELDRFYPNEIQIPERVCEEMRKMGLTVTQIRTGVVNRQPLMISVQPVISAPPVISAQSMPKTSAVQQKLEEDRIAREKEAEQLKLIQQREKLEQERIAQEKAIQEKMEKEKQEKDRLSDIILFAQSRMDNAEINACASEILPNDIKLIKLLNVAKSLLSNEGKKVEDRIYDPLVLLVMAELDCKYKPSIGVNFRKSGNGFAIDDFEKGSPAILWAMMGNVKIISNIVFKGAYEKNIKSLLGYIKGNYIDVDKTKLWLWMFDTYGDDRIDSDDINDMVEVEDIEFKDELLRDFCETEPKYYNDKGNVAEIEEVRSSLLDTINRKLDSISKKLEQEKADQDRIAQEKAIQENIEKEKKQKKDRLNGIILFVQSMMNNDELNACTSKTPQDDIKLRILLNITKSLLNDEGKKIEERIYDPIVLSIMGKLNCKYKPNIGARFERLTDKSIAITSIANNTPAKEWARKNGLRIGTNIVFKKAFGENVESCLGYIREGYIDIDKTRLVILDSNNKRVKIKDVGQKSRILEELYKINPKYCNERGNGVEVKKVLNSLVESVNEKLDSISKKLEQKKVAREEIEIERERNRHSAYSMVKNIMSKKIHGCDSEILQNNIKLNELLDMTKSFLENEGETIEDRIFDPAVLLIMGRIDCKYKPTIGIKFKSSGKDSVTIESFMDGSAAIKWAKKNNIAVGSEIFFTGEYGENVESCLGYINGNIDMARTRLLKIDPITGDKVELKHKEKVDALLELYKINLKYCDERGNDVRIEEVKSSLIKIVNQELSSVSKRNIVAQEEIEKKRKQKYDRFDDLIHTEILYSKIIKSAENSEWTNDNAGVILRRNIEWLNILKNLLNNEKETIEDRIYDPSVLLIMGKLDCKYKPTIGVKFKSSGENSVTINSFVNKSPAMDWAIHNKITIGSEIVFKGIHRPDTENCLGHIRGDYIDIDKTKLLKTDPGGNKVEIKDVDEKKRILDEFCKINPTYRDKKGISVKHEEVKRALIEIVEQRLPLALEKEAEWKLNMLQNTNSEFDEEREKTLQDTNSEFDEEREKSGNCCCRTLCVASLGVVGVGILANIV
jgi:hypothetical protein